jgi:hypothetical protein
VKVKRDANQNTSGRPARGGERYLINSSYVPFRFSAVPFALRIIQPRSSENIRFTVDFRAIKMPFNGALALVFRGAQSDHRRQQRSCLWSPTCHDAVFRLSLPASNMASNSNAVAKVTIAAVERARSEVESLKGQVHRIQSASGEQAANIARELTLRLAQAEALVARAESSVKRIRSVGRVPPRPTVSIPQAQRAKRALSVLSAASQTQSRTVKRRLYDCDATPEDSKRDSNAPPIEEVAGGSRKDDLTEVTLGQCIADSARETGLELNRLGPVSVSILYRDVFVASMWFERIEHESATLRIGHVCICAAEEGVPSRWSYRAAVRYFSADGASSLDTCRDFFRWLASHRTIFSDSVEDRRLGFDSSRGLYMPPCIRPFGAPMVPRFTRGSIPARAVVPAQANITSSRQTSSQPSTTT